jgi:dTDP-4-amino-4,6-dideoxygalactose transaminase
MLPLFKVLMSQEASANVAEVLRSGFTGQGPKCEQFEREFQQLINCEEKPLLLNSCTSALDLAYHLIDLKPGDYVISTPQTCLATNQPLLHRGVNIIWADVDPLTGNIDVQDVYNKSAGAKAVIAVDWSGRACDYERLRQLGVPIIQDAAHNSFAQSQANFTAWSFQSIKTLSMGDGGALKVPSGYYDRAKLLRWFSLDREKSADFRCAQNTQEPGFKYQSNDILASIGVANLRSALWAIERHKHNAYQMFKQFKDVQGLFMPWFDANSSYWVFPLIIECGDRDEFAAKLKSKGVDCSEVHRRNDLHDCFKDFRRTLPGLDYFSSHQLNIPCGWWLTESDVQLIIDKVKECAG